MGAQQSSQDDGSHRALGVDAAQPQKTCYYELLGVERTASHEDIRRAYKKKALELHPDRNYDDVENATRNFAEVQTAYEVLFDPQERDWYDSHRDAILRGDPDPGAEPEYSSSDHYNIRLTTTDEIMALIGRFNSSVPFDDSPNGFFGILNVTFAHLAEEEMAACHWDGRTPAQYPPFGSANDDHSSVAKPFYSTWSDFSTNKSFSWKDKYRLSDAPDRRVRRFMEKENKKMRDGAIRDFNDAVRSLVAFVKKRDPRYIPNTQSEAERQRILRESAAAQAARSRAANQEKISAFSIPDWAQSRGDEDAYYDEFATSEEESGAERVECVVCQKTFKTENQYESHAKSKKHIKAVQQLRRQMKEEDAAYDLGQPSHGLTGTKQQSGDLKLAAEETVKDLAPEISRQSNDGFREDEGVNSEDAASGDSLDDEYAPRDAVEERLSSSLEPKPGDFVRSEPDKNSLDGVVSALAGIGISEPKRVGKAKAKREKKAARQAALEQQLSNECGVCHEIFESRTKLFNHIRIEGHAQPQVQSRNAKRGKKKA